MPDTGDMGGFERISGPVKPQSGDDMGGFERVHQPSFLENVGTGLMDKFYGAAQLGAHSGWDSAFGPEISPEQVRGVDETVRKREQQIKSEGGGGWGRTIGNMVGDIAVTAPLMAAGGPVATAGARIGQSAILGATGGAVGAALDPATGQNFGAEKIGQIAVGGAVGGLTGAAIGGVESAIVSLLRPPGEKLAQQATEAVVRRLNQDAKAGGPTAEDALKAVAEWQTAGKPMTLADVGGENTKGLAGAVGRQPGESRSVSRSFLETRDKAAPERLNRDVTKFISGEPSAYQTTQALLTSRSQAARPIYQQAESLEGIWSPRLQQFLEEPDVKRGLSRGFRLERLEALAEGREFNPTTLGVDLDAEGNVLLRKVPNLRVLDMGKRGLDAMIADERDAITGRLSALGRSLEMVRRSYVGEIDGLDSSGLYQSARAAWAGPSASLDAVKFGRTIFNRNPEETAAQFAQLAVGDQEFARLGVADVLRERIAKTGLGGNEARAVIKNQWTREQLRPVFRGDQEFDKFVDAVMAEHSMAETTGKVMRGSQTAERLAEDGAGLRAAASGAGLLHSLYSMHPLAALRHTAQLYRDLGKNNEPLNEAVARLLFSTHPRFFEPEAAGRSISSFASPTVGSTAGEAAASVFGLQ